MDSRNRAFTMIEVLVVVSIIAVLMSIALPVIDRAIYAAEQAKCSMTLKSTAQGVQTYAVGHNRLYPYRPTISKGNVKRPNVLAIETVGGSGGVDDRPYLRDHVELKMLLDPFLHEVDLSADANDDGVVVYSNYAIWWGMFYRGSGGAMTRMGSKLVYRDATTGESQSFRVLVSDWDASQGNTTERVHASHADDEGVMFELVQQNVANQTRAMWYSDVTRERGKIDTNFALDDGSVKRYEKIAWDEASAGMGQQMVKVPIRADNPDTSQMWLHLPRRD